MELKDIRIEKRDKCVKVFIPKGACGVIIEGASRKSEVFHREDQSLEIEILDLTLPCQQETTEIKKRNKKPWELGGLP